MKKLYRFLFPWPTRAATPYGEEVDVGTAVVDKVLWNDPATAVGLGIVMDESERSNLPPGFTEISVEDYRE